MQRHARRLRRVPRRRVLLVASAQRRGYDRHIASNGLELSVITVTRAGLDAIRNVLAALRSQTALQRFELLVVAPGQCSYDPELLGDFAAVEILERQGPFEKLGDAIGAGIRAATAPIVAYAEEHNSPDAGWAAALIERHRGPWVAVGWQVRNANPGTTTSWAQQLADFALTAAPARSGERAEPMPWHQVSYKRDELLKRGHRLEDLLETESVLQKELLAEGKRLYMEAAASSNHINVSSVTQNLRMHFVGGRGYAGGRVELERLNGRRRLALALGSPLAPPARLMGLRTALADTRGVRGRTPGLIPSLALCLTVQAAGEAVGYLRGQGQAARQRLPFELQRERFLHADDSIVRTNA